MEKYKAGILTMFKMLLKEKVTEKELYDYLKLINTSIKSQNKNSKDKGIWFRFFNGDTLATTPENIFSDLGSSTNRKFMIENIEVAVKNKKEFQIYFS